MKGNWKELTGFSPSLSFECSSNYLWIILGNESFHKLRLYLVHEDGIKTRSCSPHSQRLQLLVFTLMPLKCGTFKMWKDHTPWKFSSCLQHHRMLMRERPEILTLSWDLRLHGKWGPSFQGVGKNCLLLNTEEPKSPLYFGVSGGQLGSLRGQIIPLLQDEPSIGMLTTIYSKEKAYYDNTSKSICCHHQQQQPWSY